MIECILEGVLLGLTLSFLAGPVFFQIVQTSLEYGFKSGIAFATGVFLSDLFWVVLSYLGASQLLDSESNRLIIGLSGGILMIVFGSVVMMKKKPPVNRDFHLRKVNLRWLAAKGFLINFVNPFVLIFWLGVVGLVSAKYEFATVKVLLFLSASLLTIFLLDITKVLISVKLSTLLNPPRMLLINRLAGALITGFGLALIYRVAF